MTLANYPTTKIITYYALLGGMVGGLVFAVVLGIMLLIEQIQTQAFRTDLSAISDFVTGFGGILIASFIVGFLPALLTGIIISLKRICLITLRNYLQIAVIGFLVSLPILGIIVGIMGNWSNGLSGFHFNLILDNVLTILGFSCIGAVSSVIVGKFVLPKDSQ